MRRFIEDMFQRPLNAFLSSAELLNRSISGTQLIDGIVSRMVHTLSRSHESRQQPLSNRAPQDVGRPRERSPRE